MGTNIVVVLSVTEYTGTDAVLGIEEALGAEDVTIADGVVGTFGADEVARTSEDGAFDGFWVTSELGRGCTGELFL